MKEHKSFIYDISPEEEETLEKNTLQKIAMKKGEEKGIAENQKEVVINSLKENIPIKTIEKITGLSEEQIKEIKQNKILD